MAIVKTKQMTSFWSARRLSILLTIIAFALWSYSLTQAKFNIGFYGLIDSFPVTFFVAVGILTVASAVLWISKENHQKLLFFQLLFLITALWLTPALIGSLPFLGDAYKNLGLINAIIEQGHVFHAWYLSWPGAHILFAEATLVGSMNLEPVLRIFPFFIQLLWLLPLYIFLRNILGEARVNYCWAGLWLFSLANWIGQEYFGPQAIAFFLMLTLLALITSPIIWKEQSYPLPFLLAAGFIVVGIVVTHLLTSFAAFCILVAFVLARRARKPAILIIVCLALILVWDVTGGPNYTAQLLSALTAPGGILVFDLKHILEITIIQSFTGSSSHIAVVQTRMILSLMFVVLGLAGAVLALVSNKRRPAAIPLSAMAIALLLLLPLAKQFGWELIHRLYLFSLPFIAYFGAMLLDSGKKLPAIILCVLLLIAVPLHIVAHYGNAAIDNIPRGEIAYWHFVRDNISEGYFTGGLSPDVMEQAGYVKVDFEQLKWVNDRLVGEALKGDRPHYINVGDWDQSAYKFLRDEPEFIPDMRARLENSVHYNLIYANPDLNLYASEAQEA
jgi:hypothetical protein